MRLLSISLFLLLSSMTLLAEAHMLTVRVEGLRSDQGSVQAALYNSPEGFPTKPDKAIARKRAAPSGGVAILEFGPLPDGVYAVSVYHDVNNNNKLDANFLGIPKEPVGSSNDAKGRMGPPSFKDAKFTLNASTTIPIKLQ